jgi:prepilin-type N-terminal cleavage/methylation domain-containing protein
MIKKDKAFTLVELLVVVAVLALLASIVFSNLTGAREQAKISNALSFQSNMHNLLGADLVGWWNFDQESGDRTMVRDSSGYGFNGDPSGTIEWREDSPSGKGYSVYLNGSRYINLYQPKLLDLQPQEDFTISLWFKAEEGVEGYFIAKRESGSIGTEQYSIHLQNNRIYYSVGGVSTFFSEVRVDDNTWHHVILANYNDNGTQRYKVFIDGTAITPIGTSGTYTNEVDILIGARRGSSANTGSGYFYTGLIDDVRIYSRALTAYEVQTLYAQTKDNYLAEEQ